MSYLPIFKLLNMSFNAICENKMLAKISGFTEFCCNTHSEDDTDVLEPLLSPSLLALKLVLGLNMDIL